MILFYQPGIVSGVYHLDAEESRHCVKVLRKREGDTIAVTDGQGYFYEVTIQKADIRQCTFSVIHKTKEPLRKSSIHIAISPTKNIDRMEWFVEKCVEFGIDCISFVQCQHSERLHFKKERMERIAISAMKQSLKATLPTIQDILSFDDFIVRVTDAQKFIAVVDPTNPHHLKDIALPGSSYCVMIGPEGDFSANEVGQAMQHGYSKVSLGQSRLRTETAGVAACHVLNLINE